jgi:ornithine cyclodeaminase/alanine dehydrogenase-like protein (mu-crystallin family)
MPTDTLQRLKLVVDEFDQTSRIGGINVPYAEGLLDRGDIHAEIGETILGEKIGRLTDEEVTIFVTSGLSIQDISTVQLVYETANEEGLGTVLPFPFFSSH